jgi:RNA polymerase sigma factor (sigma-70 family)
MTDDSELLRQYLQDSSESAFAELVRRHVDFVYGVALRHARNSHRAEDIVQMVFIALARKGADLSGRTELVGWLYTSARYAAAKIVRAEVRREARERRAQMIEPANMDDSAAIDWQRLQPVLDDALEGIGSDDRSALLLRFFKNRSFQEIGTSLRVSEEAARKRVNRALEKLRRRLAQRGITSTSAALAAALGGQTATAAPTVLAANATAAALLARTAGGSGTLLLRIIHSMTASKTIGTAAIVAACLTIGAAYRESALTRRAAAELTDLRKSFDNSALELKKSREHLAAAQAKQKALARSLQEAWRKAEESAAETQRERRQKPGPFSDPKIQALTKEKARIEARQVYGRFFAAQQWSSAQIDAFLKLKIDGAFQVLENGWLASMDNTAGIAAAERTLLGDEGLQQLQAYERGVPYEPLLQRLAGYVFAADPLSPQQAQAVVQRWAESGVSYADSLESNDWQGLLDHAQGVLTATQLEILRQMATARTGMSYSIQSQGKPVQ